MRPVNMTRQRSDTVLLVYMDELGITRRLLYFSLGCMQPKRRVEIEVSGDL